jgi:hypothetical protein
MSKTIVNYRKIALDISEGYDVVFNNEFPEAKDVIEKLRKKPKCGTCLMANIPSLFNQPEFEEKIKLIYGDDVEYDLTPPSKSSKTHEGFNQNVELLEFTEKEWKEWWTGNMNDRVTKKFQHIATYYKPETKTVVASIVYFKKG